MVKIISELLKDSYGFKETRKGQIVSKESRSKATD